MCGSVLKNFPIAGGLIKGLTGGSTPAYTPPPAPAPLPVAPRAVDASVSKAREDERRRAAAMGGQAGTIATGTRGILSAATTTSSIPQKSLLAS